MDYKQEYERWLQYATEDQDIVTELKEMREEQIEDAFYRNLAFGTGGLRGTIGAGTNRMNVYTVAKASQGLADYLVKHFETPSVVIGYDSRYVCQSSCVCVCCKWDLCTDLAGTKSCSNSFFCNKVSSCKCRGDDYCKS